MTQGLRVTVIIY